MVTDQQVRKLMKLIQSEQTLTIAPAKKNPEIHAAAVGAGDKNPETPVMAKDPVSGLEVKSLGLDKKVDLPEPLKKIPVTDHDPVCGTDLSQRGRFASYSKSSYKGKSYYFRANQCKKAFDQDPERYLHKPKPSPVVTPPIAPSGIHRDARGRALPGSIPPAAAAAPAGPGGEGRQHH